MSNPKYLDVETRKRLWGKVAVGEHDECWAWLAGKNTSGYGHMSVGGSLTLAHRLVWILCHGQVPEGLCVCHSCDNTACVNPRHLWVGTHADNMADRCRKGRQYRTPSEECHLAKLTESDVVAIRHIWGNLHFSQRQIGEFFGVSDVNISYVVNRKTWRNV